MSNTNDSYENENAATVNSKGNIFFPVVNRIMIQIKNKDDNKYYLWGNAISQISNDVIDLSSGRIICRKHFPIPPIKSSSIQWESSQNGGREKRVYELKDFANSIILYSKGNRADEADILEDASNNPLTIISLNDSNDISISRNGYEIQIWLENQYKSTQGMTKDHFNIIKLTKAIDSNGNIIGDGKIKFKEVDPPSKPLDISLNIAFNNLIDNNISIHNGDTYVELKIKDPLETAIKEPDENSKVKLGGIKFQYANFSTIYPSAPEWTDVSRIYDLSFTNYDSYNSNLKNYEINLSGGLYEINRFNDNSNSVTTQYRYYYIKLSSDSLNIIDNSMNKNHQFRVSYKNASHSDFSEELSSNIITIEQPTKPTINSIKMIDYNTLRVEINKYSKTNKIIEGLNNNDTLNNDMGVFLREINFDISYNNGTLTNFLNQTKNISTKQNSNHYYYFDITNANSNTNPITYYFQAKIANNIYNGGNKFSTLSDVQSIIITKPNMSSNNILFEVLDTTKNNTIKTSWSHASDGNRGVISSQSNPGLPKIEKYDFSSTNLRLNGDDNKVSYNRGSNTSARNADPIKSKEFTFYDALKYNNIHTTLQKTLDLEIRAYNEYVNDFSEFSKTISATATKPGEVTNINGIPEITNSTTKNNITINWTAPNTSSRGLTIGSNSKDNTITDYDLSFIRTTKNKYLLGKMSNSSYTDVSYVINISNDDTSNDKISITDANTTLTLNSNTHKANSSNVFLWPDCSYNYIIKTTNSLGYQTTGIDNSFSTNSPSKPSSLSYFTSTHLTNLHQQSSIRTDIKNHKHYLNKGLYRNISTPINSNTTYIGTLIQITKRLTTDIPSDITSNTKSHILNQTNFQDNTWNNSNDTVVRWTDNYPDISSNQCQFKIFNIATETEIYSIGASNNYLDESGNTNLFSITRNNRQDAYKLPNHDTKNIGYWYMEDILYSIKITTTSIKDEYLYKPLKYELRSYYNYTGYDDVSANSHGNTIILENTTNINNYIYFDDLSKNPTITKYNGYNMIEYNTTNKINGVPNLYIMSGYSHELKVTYKIDDYSKYFLLDKSENVSEHMLSYANTNPFGEINWENHSSDPPTINDHKYKRNLNSWDISGYDISSTIPLTNTTTTGISLKIKTKNTHGISEKTIGNNDSIIHKFIYDKVSVELVKELLQVIESTNQPNIKTHEAGNGQIMQVPTDFDPFKIDILNGTQGSDFTGNVFNTFDTYNDKQLILYNGRFSSSKYLSQNENTFYKALISHKSDYGITATFKNDSNDSYSWVIYKFKRVNKRSSEQSIKEFVISFYNNTNITDTNIENEDAVIFIQVQRKNGLTTTINSYKPSASDGAITGLRYKWIRYKSSGGAAVAKVANTEIDNPLSFNTGLGSMKTDFDKTGFPSYIGPKSIDTIYNNSSKNLSGVFFTASEIKVSEELIFYIAVGIKNNKNLYISKINSFDLFYADGNIVR